VPGLGAEQSIGSGDDPGIPYRVVRGVRDRAVGPQPGVALTTRDPLADLKARTAASSRATSASVDDELAALKARMADPKKK